jgi:aminodeoxyfutalosine synthase
MRTPEIADRFRSIRDKVEQGGRLDLDDGIFLYSPDVSLQEIGQLANLVRERLNGKMSPTTTSIRT